MGKTTHIEEITKLYLLESNCLPILTYAIPALGLNDNQLREMNVAWNSIYRTIFGFRVWESVTEFIAGLGKLNFKHIWLKLYLNFIISNINSNNEAFRYLVLRCYVSEFDKLCTKYDLTFDEDLLLMGGTSHGLISKKVHELYKRILNAL